MLNRRTLSLAAMAALAPRLGHAVEGPLRLRTVAESFPPLQYVGPDGQVRGACWALLKAAVQALSGQLTVEIGTLEFLPLPRALQRAAAEADLLMLSAARTPDREPHYHWLGPLVPYELWLYRHRSRTLPPLPDLAALRGRALRFGVQNGSNFEEWLRRRGLGLPPDNGTIDAVSHNSMNLVKARLGRIDLFAHPDISFAYRAAERGLDPAEFEKLLRIDELSEPLWGVMGLQSNPRLVVRLQDALQQLQHSGRAQQLRSDALREFKSLYRL